MVFILNTVQNCGYNEGIVGTDVIRIGEVGGKAGGAYLHLYSG